MMKSWYVSHPDPVLRMLKPMLYCVSDNGCVCDGGAIPVAFCLRARLRSSREAIFVKRGGVDKW